MNTHDHESCLESDTLAGGVDDPLLNCLAILTRHWNRPRSIEALRAGLPLQDGRMTPSLFVRAAERADLSARLVRRDLRHISSLTLPAVLVLGQRQACILFDLDVQRGVARILLPELGGSTTVVGHGGDSVPLDQLEQSYSGMVLFVRPNFMPDGRETGPDPVRTDPQAWFWGVLSRLGNIYGEVIFASLMLNIFTLISPLFTMNVYDRVVPNNALETLWVLAIGATAVYGFDFVLRSLRGYFLDMAGRKADVMMASTLFEHVMGLQMSTKPASSGVLAKHLQEFESLRDFMTSATTTALIDLPFAVLFLVVIGYIGGYVVWVPAVATVLVIVAALVSQVPLARTVQSSFRESSQKHAVLVESISALETVKVTGSEGVMQGRWEDCVNATAQSGMKSRYISMLTSNFSMLVQQLTTIGVMVLGVYRINDGAMTTGGLIACSILAGRVLAPLAQITSLLMRFQQSLTSLRTLNKLMSLPVERPRDVEFLSRPTLSGAIEFDRVSFQYPGQETPLLQNVSFRIQPGEKIAVIGRIGSGKSTLLKLMVGFYPPSEGAIRFDGIDIRQIDPADLRRNIGCVLQEPTLFYGSLRFNIALHGNNRPQQSADQTSITEDAALLEAARLAGVDEFAHRHPRGYDMLIGEQGKGLSGGQRQAVAIARALLRRPPILLMDEPTSSMDSNSEEGFKNRLAPILPRHTLLMVTHKTSLLTLVDRVMFIDDGRLVADGPKKEVLAALATSAGGQARPA
jgi:ATP-binding cassette subfamily C protein LapB